MLGLHPFYFIVFARAPRHFKPFYQVIRDGCFAVANCKQQLEPYSLALRDCIGKLLAADVLLFPSRFDTMANVVLEAMASGLPVIVSPRDGAAELVQDARAGIVLDDPTDARGIARTLDGLVSPQTREAFAQRARSVAASLTWEKHFAQFDALMSSVIAQKNMGRAVPCVDMQPDMA